MAKPLFRIGLDFDDVLIASADHTVKIHNDLYGTHLTRDNWYDDPSIVEPWNVTQPSEIVGHVIDIQQMDVFTEVPPLQGAQAVLRRLKDEGHTLIVITGRPESLRERTLELMQRYYPDTFEPDALHFTDHFSHQGERIHKGDVALKLELTHFVDDVISHANNVASKGIKTILFGEGYRWNQSDPDEDVVRLNTWEQIGDFFDAEHPEA